MPAHQGSHLASQQKYTSLPGAGELVKCQLTESSPGKLIQYQLSGSSPGKLVQYQLFGRASWQAGTIPACWDSQAPGELALYQLAESSPGELVHYQLAGSSPGELVQYQLAGSSPGKLVQYQLAGSSPGELVQYQLVGRASWQSGTIPACQDSQAPGKNKTTKIAWQIIYSHRIWSVQDVCGC
ncbi:hypothetical protein PCASD_11602 [Puccinia coronata f. sp. avenae]|uniref:Uncharacterized protein n=1 Tax=Puccinia coronata f. sp. avenae TaxID=200324 RepID=A0A2N5U8R1_9BASI|nr:hypothetical protein PCASD_11602 [Puccinia coronata f. sp. avenae]